MWVFYLKEHGTLRTAWKQWEITLISGAWHGQELNPNLIDLEQTLQPARFRFILLTDGVKQ